MKQSKNINLVFNIDGIPIFNSSPVEFWPILCLISEEPDLRPLTIALYRGKGKPLLEEFLEKFVSEVNTIIENGIQVGNNKLSVKIKCFVCDSPARSFIKGITN